MVRSMKSCLQVSMKLVNSFIGMAGIAMVRYSLWLIRFWQRDMEGSSSDDHNSFPWFIQAFIALGISLCAITCFGHVAVDTANAYCLSFYMITIFLLLLLETTMIADVFLNSGWEKDLPTGRFDDFKDFVKSNTDTCKWISPLIVMAQGLSILLAACIITLPRTNNESDDNDDDGDEDSGPPRLPLVHTRPVHPLPYLYGRRLPYWQKVISRTV